MPNYPGVIKNDKICVSKPLVILSLVALLLVGFVAVTGYINSSKLSTSSKAAAPASSEAYDSECQVSPHAYVQGFYTATQDYCRPWNKTNCNAGYVRDDTSFTQCGAFKCCRNTAYVGVLGNQFCTENNQGVQSICKAEYYGSVTCENGTTLAGKCATIVGAALVKGRCCNSIAGATPTPLPYKNGQSIENCGTAGINCVKTWKEYYTSSTFGDRGYNTHDVECMPLNAKNLDKPAFYQCVLKVDPGTYCKGKEWVYGVAYFTNVGNKKSEDLCYVAIPQKSLPTLHDPTRDDFSICPVELKTVKSAVPGNEYLSCKAIADKH